MIPCPALTLAIEISNPGSPVGADGEGTERSGVALGWAGPEGVKVLGHEAVRPASRHDDDLFPALERLFASAGKRPGDLHAVALSLGPGGFTGLRVAVAAAKMIAEATGARCLGVPTARALIRRVDPSLRSGREAAVMLAWKREDVWVERYAAGGSFEPIAGGSVSPLESLGLTDSSLVVADAAFVVELERRGLVPVGAAIVNPRFDASAVLEASVGLPAIDPAVLLPIYPREPEAVTKWRALKSK